METIAILGAGNVGLALGERLAAAGAIIRFGVRDPSRARNLAGPLAGVPSLLPAAAAAGCEIVILAVPAAAALNAARDAGDLDGRILIDCTNPLRWDAGPVWAPPPAGSMAQALAEALPRTAVIKGFNHFGAEVHLNPMLAPGPTDAFFAGDDAAAKSRVIALAGRAGFRAHDAGPLRNAALLENLAVLWIHLAMISGVGRTFAFRMEKQA